MLTCICIIFVLAECIHANDLFRDSFDVTYAILAPIPKKPIYEAFDMITGCSGAYKIKDGPRLAKQDFRIRLQYVSFGKEKSTYTRLTNQERIKEKGPTWKVILHCYDITEHIGQITLPYKGKPKNYFVFIHL